ncbi:hypothetical protein SRHO_G00256250 [Serrasalmus rhombeus]
MSRNTLFTNQELHKGESLISTDGNHKAIFQDDGNFVVYSRKPVWASETYGKPGTRLILQEDGNLVLYTDDSKVIWPVTAGRRVAPRTTVCPSTTTAAWSSREEPQCSGPLKNKILPYAHPRTVVCKSFNTSNETSC